MNINKNRFGKITEINNESVLVNLNNQVFVTQRTINKHVISFNVYILTGLVSEFRNSIAGVYRFAYRDAVELANGLAQ